MSLVVGTGIGLIYGTSAAAFSFADCEQGVLCENITQDERRDGTMTTSGDAYEATETPQEDPGQPVPPEGAPTPSEEDRDKDKGKGGPDKLGPEKR